MKKLLLTCAILLTGLCGHTKSIESHFHNGIYHIVLKGDRIKKQIQFVSSDSLITNAEAHKNSKSKLTINTGFFDPKNQKTISYIVTDSQITADPMLNESLIENPELNKNLNKILNRTEFRVVACDNKYHYEIVPHKDAVEFGCEVVTSAQAGPMLLPEMRLEKEFFVVKKGASIVRDSISALKRAPRTVIGIKDGNAHILIITKDNPMTLRQARDLCFRLGFERAMAFDGGSSTSLNYKDINITSTDVTTGRLLKSFMIVR